MNKCIKFNVCDDAVLDAVEFPYELCEGKTIYNKTMMKEFKKVIDTENSIQTTENGAKGYSTTDNLLVDLNFVVPSNHDNVDESTTIKFCEAVDENPVMAIKWLFYLRDVREGLGERNSFIKLFLALYNHNEDLAFKTISLIPEYGRWKDLIDILFYVGDDTKLSALIYDILVDQLKSDYTNMMNGKPISLLGKWLPSINASSTSRVMAIRLAKRFGLSNKNYRKTLSCLRKYLDVTEIKTCGNKWDEIDYNKVSSNANARYVKAFMKHDYERRTRYLQNLENNKPGTTMHATNLYPYEVYTKYNEHTTYGYPIINYSVNEDPGVEALWNNLKNIETMGNVMVVVDGSGSMKQPINKSNIMAIDVSRSLGVFFSERMSGEYKDKVIEFSASPRYIDLSTCKTLAQKYNKLVKYTDCSNTDIEKVFDLLLKTAITNHIPQSEMPEKILIISDMEFDDASDFRRFNHNDLMSQYNTLFEDIRSRWSAYGYTMPGIVFWNVNSRTNTMPVKNECGVMLVSGFSVNNAKMIMSGAVNPWSALKAVLDGERYSPIENALK